MQQNTAVRFAKLQIGDRVKRDSEKERLSKGKWKNEKVKEERQDIKQKESESEQITKEKKEHTDLTRRKEEKIHERRE